MDVTISLDSILNFLHSFSLTADNKKWIADHLYEEAKAEEKVIHTIKNKRKMSDKERDELFEKMVGAWKEDNFGDKVMDAIRIGRRPVGYERKIAYLEEEGYE